MNWEIILTSKNGTEYICKTNDINDALEYFLDGVEADNRAEIINGFTGEVLCVQNAGEDDYITNEFSYLVLGFLCAQQWG